MEAYYGSMATQLDTITVPVATLDDLSAGEPVSLLKADVRGAELQVLAGRDRHSHGRRPSFVECLIARHSEQGESAIASVFEALTSRGFALWDIMAPKRAPNGRALWVDALYVRSN
jgi:hypothetical protein